MFLPKDFIETAEGLLFAVVVAGLEAGKIRCFLRYVRGENGRWRKVQTDEANALLAQYYPDYCFHSPELDAFLHAVSVEKIIKHHHPQRRLTQILERSPNDDIENDCVNLCLLFKQNGIDLNQFGVTGSLLIGQQKASSDIDLVCYDTTVFHQCRAVLRDLIEQNKLSNLKHDDWIESYERRDCDLNLENYIWHEQRKANKALINGRKFDLSLIVPSQADAVIYQKCGTTTLCTMVTDDTLAFSYPAEFKLSHSTIQSVVCFTATYTGQAIAGETIEISGQLEQDAKGNQRLVVGSTREARGEYIKVIR